MRRKGFQFWHDNLHPFWSFGFDLYRTTAQFSSGKGPTYGFMLLLGPWRAEVTYSRPYSAKEIAYIRAAASSTRRAPR